jgi:hypothetical protein
MIKINGNTSVALSMCQALFWLLLCINLFTDHNSCEYYYCYHFTDEEAEEQGDLVMSPKSYISQEPHRRLGFTGAALDDQVTLSPEEGLSFLSSLPQHAYSPILPLPNRVTLQF